MVLPRFFVPDAARAAGIIPLPPDEAHHLTHVLRLRAGEPVGLFDGQGGEWHARVVSAGRRGAEVAITGAARAVPEPPVVVTLAVALLKGAQMDAVVRDATMLGAAAIIPVISDHVAARAPARPDAARARWRRVAVASARQCGRAVVPAIDDLTAVAVVLDGRTRAVTVMAVEPARATPTSPLPAVAPASALVLVGPEGGWSDREIAAAADRGARLVSLGPRTLRAETAPVVLLSALWSRWGWQAP